MRRLELRGRRYLLSQKCVEHISPLHEKPFGEWRARPRMRRLLSLSQHQVSQKMQKRKTHKTGEALNDQIIQVSLSLSLSLYHTHTQACARTYTHNISLMLLTLSLSLNGSLLSTYLLYSHHSLPHLITHHSFCRSLVLIFLVKFIYPLHALCLNLSQDSSARTAVQRLKSSIF